MRTTDFFLLVAISRVVCCAGLADASSGVKIPEASVQQGHFHPNNQPTRYLRGNENSIWNEDDAANTADEERAITNIDSAFTKSASFNKLKYFTKGEAELNKVKTLLKKTPSLGKMRAMSLKEAEMNKVKNIVAKNPELRRAKSLVTNHQKLTKDELKLVEKFAKEHPKEGSSIMQWIFLFSGLAVVLGVGGVVIGGTPNSGKK
uniref:RxLR effector protein n=1 Tax=Phytophthora sojae TaxID=67593 RepID=G1FRH3_PHYSO|nr:Avh127 [Phytophthora sojae]